MARRIISVWVRGLPSQRVLRRRPRQGPFVLVHEKCNTFLVYCLNGAARERGLFRGMGLADARAICPDLRSEAADPQADRRFLLALVRWAHRYCPIVCSDGGDGLLLDITGAVHLFGSEECLVDDLVARLGRAGLFVRVGLADSAGAARALARFGTGRDIALPGRSLEAIGRFPVQALGLDEKICALLGRLGIRTIFRLHRLERKSLVRRVGQKVLDLLDRAIGEQSEVLVPQRFGTIFAARMNLAEPIGLERDVREALGILLHRVCKKLEQGQKGARRLRLAVHRVDGEEKILEIGLARPMRDAARMGRLFERGISGLDAGFGIERLELEARDIEPLVFSQLVHGQKREGDDLCDLITRIGNRIGFDNVVRYLPAQSHIPEKSFIISPAAHVQAASGWRRDRVRPLIMFSAEAIGAGGSRPPRRFSWRGSHYDTARVTGPERILPEWWLDDPGWRSGMRDYWFVQTCQGSRLWLFHTPQIPAHSLHAAGANWFVQGEFA